jgi:receptor protein-tyrosine kinase
VLTVKAEKQYSSTSALLLRPSNTVEPQRVVDTNLQLLTLPEIASRTAETVGELNKEEVTESITTAQQGESDIIQIKATANSPDLAAELANAFAKEFIGFREKSTKQFKAGVVELVEKASPESSPVSPKPVRNIVFGALIGLVLGFGLALLLEQLDRRVKREDDLAEATGLPLLATIPKRSAFDRRHLGQSPLSPAETEIFRLLRSNLRYSKADRTIHSVVVTSAESGEGKTLVSLGLALAAASSGERVLLIEGDLRRPGLSDVLHLRGGYGLSDVLATDGPIDVSRAVTRVNASQLSDAVVGVELDVLGAGQIPPNPSALIESKRMRDLLAAAEDTYDFVVIDTPPVLVVSDAMPLIVAASGVLAVSGLGVATRGSAANLVFQLQRLAVPVLGLVANFAERSGRSYDGYGYGLAPEVGVGQPSGPPPTS